MSGGSWGLWSGLGQGLTNAGSIFASLQQAAADRALRQQMVQQQGQQLQSEQDAKAIQTYQETGQDMPGYFKGQRGEINPSGGLSSPDVSETNSPSAPQAGTGPGALPSSLPTPQSPASALAAASRPGQGPPRPTPAMGPPGAAAGIGAYPAGRALQAASQGTPGAPTAPAAPGFDASQFVIRPGDPRLAGLPLAAQRELLMRSLIAAQTQAGEAGLKGVPQAVNPQELDVQNRTLAETTRSNKAKEANEAENIRIMGGIRSAMMGLTEDRTAEGMATKFADQTKDDRKAGPIAQQLDDAYGQAMGITTPDHKPNPTALKALIVNQIANTEPGMQVRLGTLKFNGTGGDMSAAGQIMSNISVAIGGLPLQQQMQQLHGLAQQMIRTKAQRYASMYQAEAAAHPDIPHYEQRYLEPTMSPQRVFGHYAPQPLNPGTLAQAKAALSSGKDPTAVRSHYSDLTGRDYDADAAEPGTAATAAGAGKP